MIGIIDAIARQEGFGQTGSRAHRNNNPGNLNYSDWVKANYADSATLEKVHAAGERPRFAEFCSSEVGFQALRDLLTQHYSGLTITNMVRKFAPWTDNNNVNAYIHNVCTWTGLTADTVINDHL